MFLKLRAFLTIGYLKGIVERLSRDIAADKNGTNFWLRNLHGRAARALLEAQELYDKKDYKEARLKAGLMAQSVTNAY